MYPPESGIRASKKGQLARRICVLAVMTSVVSVISIVIGIVAIVESGTKFPYNAGGAMIAGIMAFLLSLCPMCMFYEAKKTDDEDSTGCFDCCAILMSVWFCITILAIPIGFGMCGIYGVIECVNPSENLKVCTENADTKLTLSMLTIALTSILFILSLAIFFTCCCNAKTFGLPVLDDTSHSYTHNSYNRTQVLQELDRQHNDSLSYADVRARQTLDMYRPCPNDSETSTRNISEPSVPARVSGGDEIPGDDAATWNNTESSPHERYPTRGGRESTGRYDDPPPSYDEVMKQDSPETAV